jgi:hypothetical protein
MLCAAACTNGMKIAGYCLVCGNIVHHRNDLAKLIFLRQIHTNPFADGVLVRKEPPRHGLFDYRHPRRMNRIAIGEIADVSGLASVTAAANSLTGTYAVTATANGSSVSFALTNTARPQPLNPQVSPSFPIMHCYLGTDPGAAAQTLSVSTDTPESFSVSSNLSWLSVTAGGSTPGSVRVTPTRPISPRDFTTVTSSSVFRMAARLSWACQRKVRGAGARPPTGAAFFIWSTPTNFGVARGRTEARSHDCVAPLRPFELWQRYFATLA